MNDSRSAFYCNRGEALDVRPYIKMASRAARHPLAKAPRPISRTLPPIATTRGATRRHTAHRFRSPPCNLCIRYTHAYTSVVMGSDDSRRSCSVCRYCRSARARSRLTSTSSSHFTRLLRVRDHLSPFLTLARRSTDNNSESHAMFLLSKWMGAPITSTECTLYRLN